MFLPLFASWLLLILSVWIGSGIWEKYLKVCRYPTYTSRELTSSSSSAIIHDIQHVPNPGVPCVIYFFFDFKDEGKQDTRALLSSLLIQLCDQFDSCFKVLFDMYSSHKRGEQQPSEDALLQCLKDMLLGSGQSPIYLIVDALDECPDASKELGAPPSRQMVLNVVKELVELRLSNLHICVTSRPEADIRRVLAPLAGFKMSLHDQNGQKEAIASYVCSVVDSNKEQGMKRWKRDVKDLVIKTLSEKANGMYGYPSIMIFMTGTHTVSKVSLGRLSTGNTAEVSYTECPSCAERIAEISR
jgi:hypothetical protein